MAAQPLPQIPGYQLMRVLGHGGMGTVYHARHEVTGNHAAIKVFAPKAGSLHDEALRRFRHEMKALSRLSHPNIVGILHADQVNGLPYLIMEFVDGIDLEQLLDERGPLPVPLACEYVRQVALGLQHAHEQGLVHRDIKPANIMIARSADGTVRPDGVKLLDLGLARLFSTAGQSSLSLITEEGFVVGTPDYIAPEQIADSHRVDIRTDIYSLGCSLYHILTGQVPFPAADVLAKLDRHRWNPGRPVELLRPEVPAEVGDIVRKMMAKQPQARYQTPAELAAALADWLGTRPIVLPAAVSPTPAGHDAATDAPTRADATVPLACLELHASAVHDVVFLPDGKLFLSAAADGLLQLCQLERGMRLRSLRGHTDAVHAVALTPDGRRAVSASADGRVMSWDLASGKHLRTLQRLNAPAVAVNCLPDGQRLLVACADGNLYLRQLDSGVLLTPLTGHRGPLLDVAVSAAGHRALSASADQTVRLWDLENGQELLCLGGEFHRVALSASGEFALGVRPDHMLRLWRFASGTEIVVEAPGVELTSLTLAAGDTVALTGCSDGRLLLWDVPAETLAGQLASTGSPVTCVSFSPDGRYALAGSQDGTIRHWRLPRTQVNRALAPSP